MSKKPQAISDGTIMNERLNALELQFREWLKRVRLNSEERDEVESIIDELRTLAEYK